MGKTPCGEGGIAPAELNSHLRGPGASALYSQLGSAEYTGAKKQHSHCFSLRVLRFAAGKHLWLCEVVTLKHRCQARDHKNHRKWTGQEVNLKSISIYENFF